MTDDPAQPSPRYRRMWMEVEVELVDENKLREFDLHPTADQQGNLTGLSNKSVDERIRWAVGLIATQAWLHASDQTGLKISGSMPLSRPTDDDGYPEVVIPRMPQRNDDGTYPDLT